MVRPIRSLGDPDSKRIQRWLSGRRISSMLPWIGLLLVYVLSSLTADGSGRAPTQRNWVFGRLSREHSFGQTFVVERDDLVAVRVLLLANPTAGDEPITLHLRYADRALPDLAAVTLPARALARHDLTTFALPPLTLIFPPQLVTTTLRIDLEAPTLAPQDWITVMAGPDTYPRGTLFEDGAPRPWADLAFQPVYRQRWFDRVLPITRLAHDKPGLLGWPPFYALLAYGYCLVLAHILVRIWRTVHMAVVATGGI